MRASALIACLALLASCSTTFERRDWSHYDGPGAEYFKREEVVFPHVDDPLEPTNRVLAMIDYGAYRYLIAPLCALYRNFVPGAVRKHLTAAGENFLYPRRVLNNILQWKWSEAAEETSRFVVNTTVGVGGLYDPAKGMGLDAHDEDFGQTFAKWGWKHSTYFFLPLYGPSTIRDATGKVPDELSDPLNYVFALPYARRINRVSDEVEGNLRIVESYFDPYEPARTLYALDREVDVTNFSWRRDESAATQTLDSIFLTFEDPWFPERRNIGRADVNEVGRVPPYTYWLQKEPSPLVYIVPGLGGHRESNSALGLAEIAYQRGNSVVLISNPTNWEFVESAASVDLPGYVPVDARDLHRALTAIDHQMEGRYPGAFTSKRLAGISLGAFQTLFIAADEARAIQEGLMAFDVYLAMDAPVSLEHAMHQLDRFYNAPLEFPAEEREQKINELLAKVLYLSQGDLTPAMELPFTQLEAQFLIGLSFRMDLQFVIVHTQERHDMGVLRTKRSKLQRAPVYREASEYSYMEYVYAFLLPYYATRDSRITFDEAGARSLFERCDLHSIADGLRSNDKVRVFANENDFLLRPEDIAWLRDLLGDRAHFFPAGGHLGNLHRKTIQEIIQSTMERAADDPERAVIFSGRFRHPTRVPGVIFDIGVRGPSPRTSPVHVRLFTVGSCSADAGSVDEHNLPPESTERARPLSAQLGPRVRPRRRGRLRQPLDDRSLAYRPRVGAPADRSPAPVPGFVLLRAAIHVHSRFSHDCDGSIHEIAKAAKACQVQVVFLTDHTNPKIFERCPEGWVDGVYFVRGEEISKQGSVLALGTSSSIAPHGKDMQELIDEVLDGGGVAALGHLEQTNTRGVSGYSTVSIHNLHADANRISPFLYPKVLLDALLYGRGRANELLLHDLVQKSGPELHTWDKLLAASRGGRVSAIAEVDAHQNLDVLGLHLDPYHRILRVLHTYLLVPEQWTRADLLDAVRMGRSYIGFSLIADPSGFSFYGTDADGRTYSVGDEVMFHEGLQLRLDSPARGQLIVMKDGKEFARAHGRELTLDCHSPGVYRAEVRVKLGGKIYPWIVSNPIYVGEPPATLASSEALAPNVGTK